MPIINSPTPINSLTPVNSFRDWYSKNKGSGSEAIYSDDWWKRQEQKYGNEYKLSTLDPNIENRFENYENEFPYEDQKKLLDEIFANYEGDINRSAAEDTADLQQGAASRMASRGITGGSIVDDTISGIGTDVGKNKLNVLGKLKSEKAKGLLGLMDTFNKSKLQTTGMASNVDFQNFANELQKLGLLSDISFRQSYLDMAEEQQPSWLEDLFSGIGDIAGLVPGLDMLGLFDGSGASPAK